MKKITITLVSLAIGLSFAHPTKALLIGSLDPTQLANAFQQKDAVTTLFNLTGTTLIDLHTNVTTNGGIFKMNGYYYFTNTKGLQREKQFSTKVKTVQMGTKLDAVTRRGTTLVVSNGKKNGRSFVYDGRNAATKFFAPTVGKITSASLNAVGTVVAMIANNVAGKSRLFISHGAVNTVQEYPLPTHATTCSTIALSTDAKTLFLACTFNLPNQPKGQLGYVTIQVSRVAVRQYVLTLTPVTIKSAVWTSPSLLFTIQTDASGVTTMIERKMAKTTITSSKKIGSDFTSTLAGRPVIATPVEIYPSGNDTLYFGYICGTTDQVQPALWATIIGLDSTTANTDVILWNDGTFKFIAES